MADLEIQRGDHGFYVTGALDNADGSDFNLTGYALTFKAWEKGNWEHPLVDSSAEVVTATQGTWRYDVQEGDFPYPAEDYYVTVRATKTGAQETAKNYTLEIKEAP